MAETTRSWPEMSADPVIQFCVIEALAARLGKSRSDVVERQDATDAALARARSEVAKAVG